jgi:kynurenine 3-monooxygenase
MQHKYVNYSQEFLNIGYKELNIPANPDGSINWIKFFHIWPRGEYVDCITLDGSFTCTLLCLLKERILLLRSRRRKCSIFFEKLQTLIDVIPNLTEDFSKIQQVH